ncbi:MAG: hypothetical protein RLZ63_1117 [Pseudomonadota bacterium]|jgi:AraC family transcriptional activator of pobA
MSKGIPNYDLYGDQASSSWNNAFNFEWIPQRSSLYHWVIQPHRHEAFVQVLYLTQGQVDFLLDDVRLQGVAPCLMVIPAGHVHGFEFSADVQGPVVTASQKALESVASVAMPQLLSTIRTPVLLQLDLDMRYMTQLMPLFLALEQESRTSAIGHQAAGTALLLALMIQVHRVSSQLDPASNRTELALPRKVRQVEKFKTMLEHDFRQEKSLQHYAHNMGVTPGQLSRLCREVLGMSGLDVINSRLIHEAQRELIYTHLPVKQLASELGFEDDAYFSRFFRKHTGLSPKAFRARALAALTQ